jgi:hypothetical protein
LAEESAAADDAENLRVARAAAVERWRDLQLELARWGMRRAPSETVREFIERVVDEICVFDDWSRRVAGAEETDLESVISSLTYLADGFLIARYASDARSSAGLIRRERDGTAESRAKIAMAYLAAGEKSAARMRKSSAGRRDADKQRDLAGVR